MDVMKPANPMLSIRHMRGRKAPPSQYSFKIQSFSLLSKASIEKIASEEFKAGDYKWSLIIYPTGNKQRDGQNHVSISLALADLSSLPIGWEVNAIVNFSVYNFLDDEYVTTQDVSVRRFHILKTEWGIAKLIDLDAFNEPSNGYLIDDTCVFGAEVFIVKSLNKGDCLSMMNEPAILSHSWKFNNFSLATRDEYESRPFVAGNYKWKIIFCPNGIGDGKGNSVSLFLALEASTLPPNSKLLVDYTVRARDQIGGHHAEAKETCFYCSPNLMLRVPNSPDRVQSGAPESLWVWLNLETQSSGFLVGDSCILEAEFKALGLITPMTD